MAWMPIKESRGSDTFGLKKAITQYDLDDNTFKRCLLVSQYNIQNFEGGYSLRNVKSSPLHFGEIDIYDIQVNPTLVIIFPPYLKLTGINKETLTVIK